MKKYTYIDLFSGPGGLCTGFISEGFIPRIAVEWSDTTVVTYAKSHDAEIYELKSLLDNIGHLEDVLLKTDKTCVIHGDINKVSNAMIQEILQKKFCESTVDVVTGGAPCESFSMAGKRLEDDDRNDLFSNILRIAHAIESKYVLFENVPGLLTKKRNGKKGGQIEYVFQEFERKDATTGCFYKVASKDVDVFKCLAADYGTPQKRERIFIVGCNSKYGANQFVYPEKTHGPGRRFPYVTVEDAFRYLPEIHSGEGDENMPYAPEYEEDYQNGKISEAAYLYYQFIFDSHHCGNQEYNPKLVSFHKALNHNPKMVKRLHEIRQGEGMQSAAERLISEGKEDIVKEYFPRKLYSSRNRRLKSDEPSYTVTSHCLDEMIHPIYDRQPTPREVARLQAFPDWYHLNGPYVKFHSDPEQDKYEQVGDAIPVLMAKALAKSIREALDKIL
ncbi:MAG: DNA cytosine methyltransferase [Clostridiales bacterium]|nr:DNA cytosine methyltransferase [Clostridiales bacterium]